MAGAIVQSAYTVDDSGASSTTVAATLTGVVAGNTLVAFVGYGNAPACTSTASDGTAYSVGDAQRIGVDNQNSKVFYLENAGAGSHTVTVTLTSTEAFRRLRFVEVSGLATSSSLDKDTGQGQTTPGTGANAVTSGATAATTNATDFVMGFSQDTTDVDPGSGTISAGTGYTISGANRIMAIESKSVAATGAQTATFTQSTNVSTVTHVVAFKESAAAAGSGSRLWLWRKTPRLEDEPEPYGVLPSTLHAFRRTFQTVGQPWMIRYRAVTHRQEPEDYTQPSVLQTILFGRTTPAAPTRQPLHLWAKPPRLYDEGEEWWPKRPDHSLFYGRPQIVVAQPYFIRTRSPFGIVPFEPEEYPQPKSALFALRQQPITQPGQPWFLLARRAPSSLEDFIEPDVPRIDQYRCFRRTPSAGAGQPWYLWRPWPLQFEQMVYVEPYDVPPYQPWMVMRNVVPIAPPPPGQGDYIIRSRRRRR